MIEFIVRGIAYSGIADHPWVLLAIIPIAALWAAGRRIQVRDDAEMKAKRAELAGLLRREIDRRSR